MLLVRVVIGLMVLFTLSIVLIRAQPYDASAVRALLLPTENCHAPCFMGMRPGETTLDQTVAFFRRRPGAHFAVQRSRADHNVPEQLTVLHWREDGSPISGSMTFANERLLELTLQGFRLYDIWLALGEPDGGQMATEIVYVNESRAMHLPTVHISFYRANGFRVNTPSTCLEFWQQFSYVVMGPEVVPDSLSRGPSLSQQRQIACEQERVYWRVISEG
jgi:hypothetical protein